MLVWSCDLDEKNGQNRVTSLVLERFRFSIFNLYPTGLSVTSLRQYICFLYGFVFSGKNKCETTYFVPSRSILGVLRDLPFYLFINTKCIIIHIHGSEISGKLIRVLINWLFLFLHLRAEIKIVVPSLHLQSYFNGKLKRFVSVVENPYLGNKKPQIKVIKKKNLLLWNSNCLNEKGYMLHLLAAKRLLEDGVDCKFIVCGKIMGSAQFRRRVSDLHNQLCSDKFQYLGVVSSEDLAVLLGSAKAISLPSFYKTECQPLAIIEGMCNGKDIVISDSTALINTVGNYPMHIVKQGDLGELITTYRKIVSPDYVNAIRSSDVELAQRRYSLEKFEKSMMEILMNNGV